MRRMKMKIFDVHTHLPGSGQEGLISYLSFIEHSPEVVGANLILNTEADVEVILKNIGKIPENVILIPYHPLNGQLPKDVTRSGWYKIHPRIRKMTYAQIPAIVESVVATRPKGLIVDCFPWGMELEYNINLALVLALARAVPQTFILVAHGGGYESWAFRAHTSSLANIYYDFSATLSYYKSSDILRPYQHYMKFLKEHVLFGSDWPVIKVEEQISETLRLAVEIGISEKELENIFLSNSRRLWDIPA